MEIRNTSHIKTTGEAIVRDFRNHKARRNQNFGGQGNTSNFRTNPPDQGIPFPKAVSPHLPSDQEMGTDVGAGLKPAPTVPISERIIKIFLWVTFGWAIGYMYHFLTTARF